MKLCAPANGAFHWLKVANGDLLKGLSRERPFLLGICDPPHDFVVSRDLC